MRTYVRMYVCKNVGLGSGSTRLPTHLSPLPALCNRAASDNVEREFHAAVRIQSWFRGERVRAYLRYLHECATLIQKCYRGHLGRKLYRRRLKVFIIYVRMYICTYVHVDDINTVKPKINTPKTNFC